MAKYILAMSSDRPSGSKGGATFQRAGSTFVIRKRNVPVQKKSPEQSASQNTFSSVQQNWRELSPEQKDTFESQAINYPRTNSLGDEYILSGQQLQASSNITLQNNDENQIESIPAFQPLPQITDAAIITVVPLSLLSIQFLPTIVPTGCTLQIFTNAPQSEGKTINSIKDLKLFLAWPEGFPQGGNLYSIYAARFGDWNNSVGQKITAWGRYINTATGQTGPFTKVDQIIQ